MINVLIALLVMALMIGAYCWGWRDGTQFERRRQLLNEKRLQDLNERWFPK